MPELPEVETTRRGVAPLVCGSNIESVTIRNRRLRWPIPEGLERSLTGNTFLAVERRAKYLIFRTASGCMLLHLGMSGSLRVLPATTPALKHDHADIVFTNGQMLRFTDPRRFGSIHWTEGNPLAHQLLGKLGPEPLSDDFSGEHLAKLGAGRRISVKPFIMDGHIVVGVGNIYANEALFASGIHPTRSAGRISARRYDQLATQIKRVIAMAIDAGGTTLKDFTNADGNPGYFRIQLAIYGHGGEPCPNCGDPIKQTVLAQRSTFHCSRCQH